MLPNEWQRVPVGKVCDSIVPGRNKPKYFDGDIPWVTTPEISGRYVPSALQKNYVSETVLKECGGKIVPKGAVVMAAVGELGLVALATEKIVLNQQLHAFVCSNSVHNEYLAYALKAQKHYMESVASKTTIPYMNKTNCESIPVPLPPLPEQKKIAQILSTWDQAITATERLLENSQQRKKGLMQELLTGKKRLPGFEGEWKKASLGAIGKISSAGVDKKFVDGEQTVRLLNYLDVFRKEFIFNNEITHIVSAPDRKIYNCDVRQGDVFFTPSSETRDEIGISAVAVEDMLGVAYSYHVIRFRPDNSLDLNFSAYAFQTDKFWEQTYKLCDGGGQRYVLSQDDFRSIRVTLPHLKEQYAIGLILKSASDEIAFLHDRLSCLKQEKKALMQQLLTGKRRVIVGTA